MHFKLQATNCTTTNAAFILTVTFNFILAVNCNNKNKLMLTLLFALAKGIFN